jgi:hypothetical protein
MESKGGMEKYLHLFLTPLLNGGVVAANFSSGGTDFLPFTSCRFEPIVEKMLP